MKKSISITLLLLIGFVAFASTSGKDSIKLRLHLKKGESYSISVKTTTINRMEVMGQNMTVSQTLESRQSFTVKDVKQDGCTIESQIKSMKFVTTQMGMTFTYDSEHPEDTSPMIADAVAGFSENLNKPFTLEYDQLGNFVYDSINPVVNQLGNIIIDLPEEEVTVGSQWVNVVNQSVSGIDIKTEMTCTVTKISKKAIEISMTGQMDSGKESMGATYEGTAIIDPQSGLVKSSTMNSTVTMTVVEQGLSIPVTSTGTTTINVK